MRRLLTAIAIVAMFAGCQLPNPWKPEPKPEPLLNTDLAKYDRHGMGTSDVDKWPETVELKVHSVTRKSRYHHDLHIEYKGSEKWPSVENVQATLWLLYEKDGGKYKSTFEFVRQGQTVKGFGWIDWGNDKWTPAGGQRVGIVYTGLARDSRRNVKEVSNTAWVTWPNGGGNNENPEPSNDALSGIKTFSDIPQDWFHTPSPRTGGGTYPPQGTIAYGQIQCDSDEQAQRARLAIVWFVEWKLGYRVTYPKPDKPETGAINVMHQRPENIVSWQQNR